MLQTTAQEGYRSALIVQLSTHFTLETTDTDQLRAAHEVVDVATKEYLVFSNNANA